MLYVSIEVNEFIQRLGELHETQQLAFVHILFNAIVNGGSVRPIFIKKLKRDEGDADGIIDEILEEHGIMQEDGSYVIQYAVDLVQKAIARSEKAKKAVSAREEIKARQSSTRSSNDHLNGELRSSNDHPRVKSKELRVKSEDNNPLYIPNGIYAPPTGGAHPSDDFDDDLGEYDDDTDNDDSYCGNDAPQPASNGVNSASNASGDELSVEAISDEKNGTFDDVAPTVQKAKKSKSKSGDVVEAVRPDDIPADLWSEWKRVRKDKGAKFLSQRAWDAIVRDAAAANVTIVQAVEIMVENHWRGFFPDSPAVQKWRDKTSVAHIASNQSTYVSLEGSDVYGSENYQLAPTHKANTKDYNYNIKPMVVPEHILKARAGFIPMHKVPGQIDDMTKWLVPKEYCSMDTAEKIAEFRRHVGLPTTNKTLQYFYEKAKAENENNNASSFAVRNLAQDKNAPY